MQKILISSITEEENSLLKGKLTSLASEFHGMHYQTCRPSNLSHSLSSDLAVLIINLHYFNSSQRSIITQVRGMGYSGPIVLTARPESAAIIKEFKTMDNLTFLEKPYDTKDLVGIVRKYIVAHQVKQRIFRRYRTNQKTRIERYTQDGVKEGTVLNLSKGGAYVVGSFHGLNVGELLRLQINLSEVDREYTMPARIIWKSKDQQNNDAIGVEFVRSDEVYKYLMNAV